MTPISRNLLVYKGITFTFFFILRDDLTLIDTVTVNVSTDVFTTASAHGLAVGDPVQVVAPGGFVPTPLLQSTDYFVLSVPTTTTFTISASYGGPIVDITAVGTGTNQVWTK